MDKMRRSEEGRDGENGPELRSQVVTLGGVSRSHGDKKIRDNMNEPIWGKEKLG